MKVRTGYKYQHCKLGDVLVVARSRRPKYSRYPIFVRILQEGHWKGTDMWVAEEDLLDNAATAG